MNPLIKQRFFVTLSNTAKVISGKPVFLTNNINVSLKNTRRIQRYREAKAREDVISDLMAKVEKHKKAHDTLKSAVDSLTDSISSTIKSHDDHRMAISAIKKKLKLLHSLKKDVAILKSITLESYSHKDIDLNQFKSLNQHISKIEKYLGKKEIKFQTALDL